jgi:hypothetical protein
MVTKPAMLARRSAARAEPPLKPCQPTRRKTVPRTTFWTLFGR